MVSTIEPEREVYPEQTMSERVSSVSALRETDTRDTSGILDHICLSESFEEVDSYQETRSVMRSDHVDIHNWDDDLSLEGLEGIQEAIAAIRKEALRVDAVLAMDQLDSVKQELEAVKRDLSRKSVEMEEQRILLRLKDDRLATLELERDLYKADTAKLKHDLKTCLEQIQAETEMSTLSGSESTPEKSMEDEKSAYSPSSKDQVFLVPRRSPSSRAVTHTRIEKGRLKPGMTQQSDGFLEQSTNSILSSSESGFFGRQRDLASMATQGRTKQASHHREKNISRPLIRRLIGSKQRKQEMAREVELTGMARVSLELQIDELQQRLKSSMETAEELRRRLAMVSRYYENVVRQLHSRLVETKTNLRKIEGDLVAQIASVDSAKKRAVSILEARLREKEAEIAKLQEI